MTRQCPNCSKQITDQRDGCVRCDDCGWFINVNGHWRTCPEPVKPKEIVPDRSVPVLYADPDKLAGVYHHEDRHDLEHDPERSYLGGLVTVTEYGDEDDETED